MSKQSRELERRIKEESIGCTVIKIPEHMDQDHGRFFRRKTEFDFCIGIDCFAAFLDAKACGQKAFYLSTYVTAKEKVHQYNKLKEAQDNWNIGGFLIWFYELKKYCFASIEVIDKAMAKGEKSISPTTDGVVLMDDTAPINLRLLLRPQLTQAVERVIQSVQ